MAAASQAAEQVQSQQLSTQELAIERTRLAHERTMMAWIRTSASMISFGFGIYKFFDYFQKDQPVHQGFVTPRRFSICLIAMGLFVLAGAAVQHWADLRRLRKAGRIPISLAGMIAGLMAVLGLLALFTAVLRE